MNIILQFANPLEAECIRFKMLLLPACISETYLKPKQVTSLSHDYLARPWSKCHDSWTKLKEYMCWLAFLLWWFDNRASVSTWNRKQATQLSLHSSIYLWSGFHHLIHFWLVWCDHQHKITFLFVTGFYENNAASATNHFRETMQGLSMLNTWGKHCRFEHQTFPIWRLPWNSNKPSGWNPLMIVMWVHKELAIIRWEELWMGARGWWLRVFIAVSPELC